MSNRICPRCDGYGIRDEDDACYHCGATGYISEEHWQQDRHEALAETLSGIMVRQERFDRDENPDGEGWAFCAAENGCSEQEYTLSRQTDHLLRIGEYLGKLEPWFVSILLDQIVPDTQPKTVSFKELRDIPDFEIPF